MTALPPTEHDLQHLRQELQRVQQLRIECEKELRDWTNQLEVTRSLMRRQHRRAQSQNDPAVMRWVLLFGIVTGFILRLIIERIA